MHRDRYAFTLGGGVINNPGRYLVLLPPINGETAASAAINSLYFTENPGDPLRPGMFRARSITCPGSGSRSATEASASAKRA
jgi:hypothetical protein